MERERIAHLTDLANAVRYAQNGTKEQFESYMDSMLRVVNR